MGHHKFYKGIWNARYVNKNKEVLWSIRKQNALTDEGEDSILETFFRLTASYIPANFYVRLCNDTLTETDTLSTILNEPTGNNYDTQLAAGDYTVPASTVGFPTKDTFEGDYRLKSKEITFTADGGDIGPVTTVFLATSSDNSKKLIAYLALPLTRTILDGDSMIVQFEVVLE